MASHVIASQNYYITKHAYENIVRMSFALYKYIITFEVLSFHSNHISNKYKAIHRGRNIGIKVVV